MRVGDHYAKRNQQNRVGFIGAITDDDDEVLLVTNYGDIMISERDLYYQWEKLDSLKKPLNQKLKELNDMAYAKNRSGSSVQVFSVFDLHTFRNGNSEMIASLRDDVLKGIILYHLQQMLNHSFLMSISGGSQLDPISARMVGQLKESAIDAAKNQFEYHMFRVMPYWLEYSAIRGIADTSLVGLFQRVFSRSQSLSYGAIPAIDTDVISNEMKALISEAVPDYVEDHF